VSICWARQRERVWRGMEVAGHFVVKRRRAVLLHLLGNLQGALHMRSVLGHRQSSSGAVATAAFPTRRVRSTAAQRRVLGTAASYAIELVIHRSWALTRPPKFGPQSPQQGKRMSMCGLRLHSPRQRRATKEHR
jgi:hypothetical protein